MHRSTPKLPSTRRKNPRFACDRYVRRINEENVRERGGESEKGGGGGGRRRIEASESGMKGDPGARVVDLCSKSSHCRRPCAVRDVSQVFSFPTWNDGRRAWVLVISGGSFPPSLEFILFQRDGTHTRVTACHDRRRARDKCAKIARTQPFRFFLSSSLKGNRGPGFLPPDVRRRAGSLA